MNTETKPPSPETIDRERRGATSASNAYYDRLCEGRHQAQLGIPDTGSDDASFGREIHEALATGDTSGLKPHQLSIYEQCGEITDTLVQQFFGPEASQLKTWAEERLWGKWQGLRHSGKPDRVFRSPTKALVIEYKTLPGDVQGVAENDQVRDQVVLVAGNKMVRTVGAAVVQPLVSMSPGLVIYDDAAIKRAESEMWERVRNSNAPVVKRTAGVAQCKFCKAAPSCAEHQKMMAGQLPAKPMHELALINVTEWSPEQRATFCEHLPVVVKWLDQAKEQIKKLLESNPEAVPGFFLEPGNIQRPVRDIEVLHDRFLALGGDTKEFLKCCGVSKEKFEAACRATTKLKGKALASKLDELLAGLTDEKQNAPSIARIKAT